MIADLLVVVDIAHQRPNDLKLFLSHAGTTVQLPNVNGGNLSAFVGHDVSGDWTLQVQDNRKKKTGTLNEWQIEVESASSAGSSANLDAWAHAATAEVVLQTTESAELTSVPNPESQNAINQDNAVYANSVDTVIGDWHIEATHEADLLPPLEETVEELLGDSTAALQHTEVRQF